MSLGGKINVSGTEGLQHALVVATRSGPTQAYHLDLPQSFIAVILQVMGLLVVDAHFTKKQLRVQPQGEGAASSHLWSNDDLATLGNLVLQDLCFGELLLLV